jgi:uncharacterized membrane protein
MTLKTRWLEASAVAVALAFAALPAQAQQAATQQAELTGFWLTTPNPELTLRAGETQTIPLTLRNSNLPPQRAQLEVSGVPQGWSWALKGSGHDVSAAIVGPNETQQLSLEITPPAGAAKQAYDIEVKANYGSAVASLPMTISLSDQKQAQLTLQPELPALRGTPRTTFSFRIKVSNDSTEDGLFNLAAKVPDGFETRFKQGYGSDEITGVPIKAGENTNITLEVVPPHDVAAGRYPISMEAASANATASTDLSIEVTGQPQVSLSGPQDRLSGDAVAGQETSFPFTLSNNGSAPAANLELSASAPSGWKATVDPASIPGIAPGQNGQVNLSITPSDKAIAGDYMVTVRASGEGVSESSQFRVTVRTSTMWGMAGLGVIGAAVIVLGLAITRYGRR